jgi:hypothetical protein
MSSVNEETKETLPVGHPQAGYTIPVHDAVLDTGTVPEAEQEYYDERVAAAQEQNEAVADHEHEVATTEPTPSDEKDDAEAKTKSTTTTKSASSSGPSSS